MDAPRHVPVLVREVVEILRPDRGGLFVDATLGLGGHAEALLDASPEVRLVGVDRDPDALRLSRERLARFGERFTAVEGRYEELSEILDGLGVAAVDGVLADLGVSSMQLDEAGRGFSFRRASGWSSPSHSLSVRSSEHSFPRSSRLLLRMLMRSIRSPSLKS